MVILWDGDRGYGNTAVILLDGRTEEDSQTQLSANAMQWG